MSTPAISPRPRDSSSHATQTRPSRPTPKSRHTTAAPLTSRRHNDLRTPGHVASGPRTPSPNYFGLAIDANADVFASSAAQHIRGNWSPPSSNVRSTAAASPRVISVDQNPEFEQFRRQSENQRAFTLANFGPTHPSTGAGKGKPFGLLKTPLSPKSVATPASSDNDSSSSKDDETCTKPRSPKRLLSTESCNFTDRPRRNSPASFNDGDNFGRTAELAKFIDERNPRASLPPSSAMPAHPISTQRAETLPADLDGDDKNEGPTLTTAQHVVNILESAAEEVLLLDLRVSTQFAKGRIAGALSLCIPTTLLKRPSFNVQKLAETFKDDEEKQKFERWRCSKYIIVYDANSTQLKDATTCINTLKKFTNEGWSGGTLIIRGGYAEIANRFPSWITSDTSNSPTSSSSSLQIDSDRPSVAPVIGGCPMPATQNAANPFFGNIRQNMDLIGGVGQLSIKHPATMTDQMEEDLPSWLQRAGEERDHGKLVSDKFLNIEKREQKRMQEALSGNVVYGTPNSGPQPKAVQIAGVEKGSKNRYNNIWPYEHSRVKLQGVPDDGCDYINANHVQASWSNKRYIATQAPISATFDDFWNVVWQQDVRVIVMLTAEQEGGQTKAHNYWQGGQYGPLHLNALGERRASLEPHRIHKHRDRPAMGQRRSTNPPKMNQVKEQIASPSADQPYVIVRKFSLANSNEPFARLREITQLQYSSWPDFGAPAHPAHLLGLIEQCDAVVRQVNGGMSESRPDPPNSRPVVVHCSAGCGRTGTFCTVDSVIDMLKRQRQARNRREGTPMEVDTSFSRRTSEMDTSSNASETEAEGGGWTTDENVDLIEKAVEDFRLQRLSMVQSLRQYVLCYESVLEWMVEQHPKSA
ncbi:tyrosine-protein phosphatase-like protein non-receptor [Polyplosphaeria fusca]|uniref:protein-tyrosine-phosphatase n=1 Tax=Polyplosphaeria fusca TaxID=682080 RepID=A0A9P4QQG1_9PLEO|nr:tyrosine-protein phosphatase-like protein non-receptor [Polyplosphaeria fusca]